MKASALMNALPVGTRLNEFEVRSVIGAGGFGIVYLAYDTRLSREVAIKEYLPASLAVRYDGVQVVAKPSAEKTFEKGMQYFVSEASILSRLRHSVFVGVLQFIEANGTAYLVMPYYRGKTLREMLDEGYSIKNMRELLHVFSPLLDGLSQIHAMDCCHLDISTDNILILKNGSPVLLDFGSSRVLQMDKEDTSTVIIKHGFAPIEQYCNGDNGLTLGPWSDIYALSAVMRLLITGEMLPSACSRAMNDTLKPLTDSGIDHLPHGVLSAIDSGLALRPEDRPQTVKEFSKALRNSEKFLARRKKKPSSVLALGNADALGSSLDGFSKKTTKKLNDLFLSLRTKKASLWKRVAAFSVDHDHFLGRSFSGIKSYFSTRPAWGKYGVGMAMGVGISALLVFISSGVPDHSTVGDAFSNKNVTEANHGAVERVSLMSPPIQPIHSELLEDMMAQEDAAGHLEYVDVLASPAADESPFKNDARVVEKVVVDTQKTDTARRTSASAAPHGQIEITVKPWGHVLFDGKLVGTVPPRLVLNASEGGHTITVSNESSEVVLDVEVKKGKRIRIFHDFFAETTPAALGFVADDALLRR